MIWFWQGEMEMESKVDNCDNHGGVCAICLDEIVLQETALVKGCEHAYWFVLPFSLFAHFLCLNLNYCILASFRVHDVLFIPNDVLFISFGCGFCGFLFLFFFFFWREYLLIYFSKRHMSVSVVQSLLSTF